MTFFERTTTYLKRIGLCQYFLTLVCPGLLVAKSDTAGPWQSSFFPEGAEFSSAVAYGNGTWVVVGWRPFAVTSSDGINWTLRSHGANGSLSAVMYGDGQWVATGFGRNGGVVVTSPDAIRWTDRNSGTTNGLFGIGYGNGQWVAVGASGTMMTSVDGNKWTPQISVTTATLRAVHYNSGSWVAVGDGIILSSADANEWTKRTSINTSLTGVSYGNGLWVAVGGTINNYGYVATGAKILTSHDAITWTERFSHPDQSGRSGFGLSAIGYANGQWVTVGGVKAYGPDLWGCVILSSSDGIRWIEQVNESGIAPKPLSAVASGNGLWLAVGRDRKIWSSSQTTTLPALSIKRSGTNAIVAWPSGAGGFILDTTASLGSPQLWTPVDTIPTLVNSQNTITHPISGSAQYYRLRRQ